MFDCLIKQNIRCIVFKYIKCKARMKSPQSSSKIQAKISPASCYSKILKCGFPNFRSTCFRNFRNWEGSDLDNFKRHYFYKGRHKRRQYFSNSIKAWPELHHSAKALKSCINIAGVSLVQNTTVLTDVCIT